MPSPGDPLPYPPYPTAGAASSGALQYALEVTQGVLRDLCWGKEGGGSPPPLPPDGIGLLARQRQQLEQLLAIVTLLQSRLPAGGSATEQTLALVKAKTDNLNLPLSDLLVQLLAIAGKDFATQSTLALVKAKADNLDITLTALANLIKGGKTNADIWQALQLQKELSESIWTDDSGEYFVRRVVIDETAGTFSVSWTDADGNASAGPGAGKKPLSSPDRETVQSLFTATAGGAGYDAGHILARCLIIDTAVVPPLVVATLWFNVSLGTTIASPGAGTYRQDQALTDDELRANPVAVSGPLTNADLRASPVAVAGPLTDAQLRALAVAISAGQLPSALQDDRLKVDAHNTARYKFTDEAPGATAYYGFVASNGDWYIMREVALSGEYRYANLSNNPTRTGGYSGGGADKAWVNRAVLTYDYFNVLTGL